jgi:hypothetical protein
MIMEKDEDCQDQEDKEILLAIFALAVLGKTSSHLIIANVPHSTRPSRKPSYKQRLDSSVCCWQ